MRLRRIVAGAVLTSTALGAGVSYSYEKDSFGYALPAIGSVPSDADFQRPTGLICAADEGENCNTTTALRVYGNASKANLPFKDLSPDFVTALVSIEDHGFWGRVDGVSARSIFRAVAHDALAGQIEEGGSTIDRQLSGLGNTYSNFFTKALGQGIEAMRAKKMNQEFQVKYGSTLAAKQKILELYSNNVYFGRQAYGVEAAAQAYFGVNLKDLRQDQRYLLAGLPNEPTTMDLIVPGSTTAQDCYKLAHGPKVAANTVVAQNSAAPDDCKRYDAKYAVSRRRYLTVIDALVEYGGVKPARGDALKAGVDQTLQSVIPFHAQDAWAAVTARTRDIGGLYFVNMVEKEAKHILQTDSLEGYKIVTTLRKKDQQALDSAIEASNFLKYPYLSASGTIVVTDGSISATYGGRNSSDPGVDFNLARRDAGSTIKPFIYAAAKDRDVDVNGPFNVGTVSVAGADKKHPWVIRDDACETAGRSNGCKMNGQDAIAYSSNSAAVQVADEIGFNNAFSYPIRMGVSFPPGRWTPAMTLGVGGASTVELAAGYNGLIANQGLSVPTYDIVKIIGPDGSVVYEHQPQATERVYSQDSSRWVIDAMKRVNTIGTARSAIESPFGPDSTAGKTGTGVALKDLRYIGSMCIPGQDTRTISIGVGDPSGQQSIPGALSSWHVAQVTGKVMKQLAETSGVVGSCNLSGKLAQ